MDRNAYRDDNGTDQIRMIGDAPRLYPDHPRTPGDQRDPYSDEREDYPDQPGTYWRRRVGTLAAGLGVLGLLAWALSGGGGKPAPAPSHSPTAGALSNPTAGANTGANTGANAGTSIGTSTGANTGTSPSAGADGAIPGLGTNGTNGTNGTTNGTNGTKTHGSSGLPSATSTPASKSAKASSATHTEPGGRCAPNSVVLTLFGSNRTYRAGQSPQFGVDAVSTAAGTCTLGLGPAQLHLVVMSAGRVIWDSADCARGTQSARLARGVPVEEYFTWDRAITLPGCVTLASSARPGSYQAQARTSPISSGTFTFKLTR